MFFKYLNDHKIHAGIVTSNLQTHVKDVLNVFNIPLDTFDIYIGNRECKHVKPDPDPIYQAMKATEKKYKPEELVGKALKDKRGGERNIHSWDI